MQCLLSSKNCFCDKRTKKIQGFVVKMSCTVQVLGMLSGHALARLWSILAYSLGVYIYSRLYTHVGCTCTYIYTCI